MGRRQTIHIPGVQHSAPIPFGARVGNVVYSSAIQGINADTGALSPDVFEQARQCFRNLRTFLAAAGVSPDDVVRMTCFLADLNEKDALNGPWLELFPDPDDRPARHTTRYDPPPNGMRVQLEVVAVAPD
jgi:2-iminobutanoate/2-iminopropanoate deaminase